MTLIIGCIAKEFAILAGDTQLTVGDLQRGENLKREIEIKVRQYSPRFMMGILGKWGFYFPIEEGKALYINHFDKLNEKLQNNKDEVNYLKDFLTNKKDIDATAIFINRNNGAFKMEYISSREDKDLSRIMIGEKEILFNEPFYHYSQKWIFNKIMDFSTDNKLNDSLGETVFLLNNIILDIISQGKELDIQNEEGTAFCNIKNTVGGYVTIQIMTDNVGYLNCLYRPYNYDFNTLLDKTTYAFSSFSDRKSEVKYLDNLAMLIKAFIEVRNDQFVRDELFKCINKQLKYLVDLKIVAVFLLNEFVVLVNEKYNLTLDIFAVTEESPALISLELISTDDSEGFNLEYVKRFI